MLAVLSVNRYCSDMFERSKPAYLEVSPHEVSTYEIHSDKLVIHDAVWDTEVIGDQPGDEVLVQLAFNPLVRRSMGIEQLTLGPEASTIPDTTSFSRWEHIWGSVVFVRKMLEGSDLSDRQKMVLQLRTFVSDLGHTAYSHLGDWMFQGSGGAEDQHDQELEGLFEASGVTDILTRHGFTAEEVVFPEVTDWIERSSPDLCVDRVDYLSREIRRWLNMSLPIHQATAIGAFELRDGQIVMRDQEQAAAFTKAAMLLSTEHWSEPVHRLQLKLQEAIVKDVLISEYGTLMYDLPLDGLNGNHPRDLLFTTDAAIDFEMNIIGSFALLLSPIMYDIGKYKRRIFQFERRQQLERFLADPEAEAYPNPLTHYRGGRLHNRLPLLPPSVSIVPVDTVDGQPALDDFTKNPATIDVFLPALKMRSIDPLFINSNGEVQRISEIDSRIASLREQHAAWMRQAYVARIHVNAESKQLVEERVAKNEEEWLEALKNDRMSPESMARFLHSAMLSTALRQFVRIDYQA